MSAQQGIAEPESARSWQRAAIAFALLAVVVASVSALALRNPSADTGDFVRFLGRFHTLLVHLPIGVLLLVATAEAATLHPKLRARLDPAIDFILPLLVVSSVGAFLLGLLLARSGGYPPNLVALHRNFTLGGIAASAVSLVVWVFAQRRPVLRNVYRGVLGTAVGLITFGAHHGGTMTRGDGYLTRYAPAFVRELIGEEKKKAADDEPAVPSEEPLVFADVVMPILKSRCVECHGPETVKGSLRLDDFAAIMKGGENGAVVVPGASEKSPFVSRLLLPMDHDDHMPPTDKPQLTSEEIELFRFWVDRGASEALRVRDTLPPDGAKTILLKAIALPDGVGAGKPDASAPPSASGSASGAASGSAEPSAEPEASASQPVASGSGDGTVYGDQVAPILEARCVRCHGSVKSKGRLRLDSIDAMFLGGKAGPAIVASDARSSRMIIAMRSAIDDKEHMPPKKEPQTTAAETELVAWWVDHGAKRDTALTALDPKLLAAFVKPSAPEPPREPTATPTETAPHPTAEVDRTSLPPEIALYTDVVVPVLANKCGSCHEGNGASAGFRTDDYAALTDASSPEPGVVPGKPEKSLLVKRIKLPLKHDDHMPPSDMPQLSPGDIEILSLWVKGGAAKDFVMASADLSKAGRIAAKAAFELAESTAPADPLPSASVSSSSAPSVPSSGAGSARASAPVSATATATADPRSAAPHAGAGCASCSLASPTHTRLGPLGLAILGFSLVLRRRARVVQRRWLTRCANAFEPVP